MLDRDAVLDMWVRDVRRVDIAEALNSTEDAIWGVVRRARAKGDERAAPRPHMRKPRIDNAASTEAVAIVEDECASAGISVACLKFDFRTGKFLDTRRRVAKRLRDELGMSLSRIGLLIDRDHSTVSNLLNQRAR